MQSKIYINVPNHNERRVNADKMLAAQMGNLNALHFVLCNAETHIYMHAALTPEGIHCLDAGDLAATRIIQNAISLNEAAQWA